jgi:hypothetical protein
MFHNLDMTVFGPDWQDLTLESVEAFLADAPTEPLEWEAKEDWNIGAIRAAVCGFANSHEGGYLLLGARKRNGESWSLDGVATPNGDPPNDVTDVLQDRGVTPYPEGLDVRAFEVAERRHAVVVYVPPISTPPCMTYGTVYERVSGKTIPVRDPARLASLFGRGDAARAAAVEKAERLVHSATRIAGSGEPGQFTFGLGAPGLPMDLTPQLFSSAFDGFAHQQIDALLIDEPSPVLRPRVEHSVSQFELIYRVTGADPRLGWDWLVCIHREGAVGINWKPRYPSASIPTLMSDEKGPVARAWRYSAVVLEELGLGRSSGLQMWVRLPDPSTLNTTVARDGSTGPTDAALKDIERELRRADGEFAFEEPVS